MNVVLHSARSIFYLIAANSICGIITAVFCLLIDDVERFAVSTIRKRFISFHDYINLDIKNRVSAIFVDLIICALAASSMLLCAFVCNSGNFRLFSIPVFVFGFALGNRMLRIVMKHIVNRILFCFKWILDIVTFPIIWFVTVAVKTISKTINIIRNKYRTKIMDRYTEYCFAHIKDEAKYGLLDDYYKELENERTV